MKKVFALCVLAQAALLCAFTAKNIYLTTNTLSSGTSIRPGFDFIYVWNGVGQGKDGCIYMAVSNHSEQQGGGDVCVTEYNPYTNVMRSLGTVTEAYQRDSNFVNGEYCNKVHTWLNCNADGKVWLGSQDGGRGSHLLYIDPATKVLHDYSKVQKYIYLYNNPAMPVLNHPELPASGNNGVAIQDCDFTTLHINPYAPSRIWTESYTNYYFHCWDVIADTTRSFPGGNQNMRVFVVDKSGNMWMNTGSGTAVRRAFDGSGRVVGTGLSDNQPSAFVYTHSYDSAFTTNRGTGNIELYDFVNDTVFPIADLPGDNISNSAYRAITISRDDRKLYVLGHSGTIYELTIATRQYVSLGSISSYLGGSYAFSSGIMDTLGNWYICTWGSRAYWVQVNLGKSAVWPLPIPDPAPPAVETALPLVSARAPLAVFPNPVRSTAAIHLSPAVFGGRDVNISVIDQLGRVVQRLSVGPRSGGELSRRWNVNRLSTGVYSIRAEAAGRSWTRTVAVVR